MVSSFRQLREIFVGSETDDKRDDEQPDTTPDLESEESA